MRPSPARALVRTALRRIGAGRIEVLEDGCRRGFGPAVLRERFLGAWERLRPRGYDERFRRLSSFYLSSSEAGFREQRIGDLQALFAKPGWR